MKVFISWSGDLSRAIAVELRDWLPMAVHQVNAWISGRDIDPGQRWALALGRELSESDFAIICLTKDNLESPWILFESGAVARSLEARVVPLLFGVMPSDLDGPLAQFQSLVGDRSGIERLVTTLYDTSDSGLEVSQRTLVFERMWPVLEERLAALTTESERTMDVESPDDLVARLTAASAADPVNRNTLERLDRERDLLRRQLDYLTAEEEKLTKQDAPISLQERAIEPTEKRLFQVESSVKTALERTFANLTHSQIGIVRDLISQQGTRLVDRDFSAHYNKQDLEALTQRGLIRIDEHGAMLAHDLVAAYVQDSFGAE